MKRAYYPDIDSWSRYTGMQVKKEISLPAFRIAIDKAITKNKILASFGGARLVPHDLERVSSKLDVVLSTPVPPPSEATPWESKTLATLKEIEVQTTLVDKHMQRHRESPI